MSNSDEISNTKGKKSSLKKPSLKNIKDKATNLTKSGLNVVDKSIQVGIDKSKKVKEEVEKVANETISEIEKKTSQIKSEIISVGVKASMGGSGPTGSRSINMMDGKNLGGNIENQLYSWYGWMWSIVAYGFIILIGFMISASNSSYALLPIVLLVGFPFFIFWAIYNSIPELKMGNRVFFSKKNLSIKQQLSFGKAVARTFSKEMIKNSPEGAFIIGAFVIFLLFILIAPFF